jgi:guanylate kinase
MKFANFFDKKIINDELEVAYAELKKIVIHYLEG